MFRRHHWFTVSIVEETVTEIRAVPCAGADVDDGQAFAHNLPVQLTSFIGRAAEMAEVRRLLAGNRLVTLTGTGGAGKTRLALQVVAGLLGEFPAGVWQVDLA